jgi:uncharacterized membrane protein
MPKGRLEAFSDGVLAVAITLLVLDLHVEAGQSLGKQFRDQWPQFAAYAVSFLIIGTIWLNHHALFSVAASVDQVVLFYNLILLMFVCTIPFTTEALADFLTAGRVNARYAVLAYGVSMEGMALSSTLIFRRLIARQLLVRPVSAGAAALRCRVADLPDRVSAGLGEPAGDAGRLRAARGLLHGGAADGAARRRAR